MSYLALADDIVLLTRNDVAMQTLLSRLSHSLGLMGLQINEKKFASLRIQVNGKAKQWFVDPSNYLVVDRKEIPAMTIETCHKYLGVLMNADGTKGSVISA